VSGGTPSPRNGLLNFRFIKKKKSKNPKKKIKHFLYIEKENEPGSSRPAHRDRKSFPQDIIHEKRELTAVDLTSSMCSST
jgi:hypothetical protein